MDKAARLRMSVAWLLLSIVVGMVALGPTVSVAGATYKCVDARGQIEYRELPVHGATCTAIKRSQKPAVDPEEEMQKLKDQVEASDKNNNTQKEALTEAEQRKQNCELARKNLAILEGSDEVVRTDTDGNKIVLSTEERQASADQTNKDIEYWCGS